MSNSLLHDVGQMGWVVPGASSEQQMHDAERAYHDRVAADYPIAYRSRPMREIQPAILERWNKFQIDRGRFAGSNDLTLVDEFVFGKSLTWLPQDIGSCVWSNTFRRIFERMCVEIGFYGQAEEWMGSTEFGPTSLAPFCVSYGFARQRANMRSGDGLYCQPMAESLLKDGLVLCNTPKLRELLAGAGANSDRDYPEVRSTALYRRIGNWAWNEALRPYADCRLLECPMVTTMDQFDQNCDQLKPMFQCSMIAMRKSGTHRDGFDIHVQDTRNQWAHNMGWAGKRVASDGKVYYRLCNTSWLQPNKANKEAYIYNVPAEEVARWFSRRMVDIATIGEIDGIKSAPPSI